MRKMPYVVNRHACSVVSESLRFHNPPPDSAVHGIFQARILEWVAISYSTFSQQTLINTIIKAAFEKVIINFFNRW